MLPGGKVDNSELPEETIIREILEETGNILESEDITSLVVIHSYIDKYNSRNFQEPINKYTKTTYYITRKDFSLKLNSNLSDWEIEGNFNLEFIGIPNLLNLLKKEDQNEKQKTYTNELLLVLEAYLKEYQPIDLHTHTIYSDGEYYPDELIEKAINEGIKTIAITDHDTIQGLENIDYNRYKNKIEIIKGIELTVKRQKGRMHILGLNIDYNNQELKKELETFRTNSINKIIAIIDYLNYIGVTITEEEKANIINKTGNIGRPEIAKLLITKGIVTSVQEAFDKYLIEAYDKTRQKGKGHTYEEVINLILNAGGIPILAHPNSLELTKEEFEPFLKELISSGLQGIEIMHSNMDNDERAYYMQMVREYNLLYSVGSDYHGESVKPDVYLAYGKNNILENDASVLSYIHSLHN